MRAQVTALLILALTACAVAAGPDLTELRSRVRAHPSDAAAHRTLGWALLEFARDPDLAYKELWAAQRIDPADLSGQKLLAIASAATGRLDAARRLFDGVLARDPEDIWMWVSLGNTLAAGRDYRAARGAYQQALRRNPQYAPALTGLDELTEKTKPRLILSARSLTDLTDLRSSSMNLSLYTPLSSNASLIASATGLSLQQGTAHTMSQDVALALGFHVSPALELQSMVQQSWLANRPVVSAGVGVIWSRPRRMIALNFRQHQPVYPENMAISRQALLESSLAAGVDWPILKLITAQGGFSFARYSDNNQKRAGFLQISARVANQHWLLTRIRYEAFSFAQQRKAYFSPGLLQLIRPEIAVDQPITKHLGIEAQLGMPLVMGRFRPGSLVEAGPRLAFNKFRIGVHYFDSSIISFQSWSGHGLQIEMSRGI